MVRIHASILTALIGSAASNTCQTDKTCQTDSIAEDVALLQGRHTVRKQGSVQPEPEIWDGSTPIPEGPGWYKIDMTVGDLTELRAKGNSFERFYRFGNAEHRIMFAPRGELGLCMAVVDPVPGFGHATTGPILSNPDNHYSPDGSTPFAPRDDAVASSELKGDNAIGLVLPFSTPKRLKLQMSSINVVDDNAAELFSEMTLGMRNITHDQLSRAVYPVSQGFMGIQTGLPQDVSQGAENYEAWYIRPSNGAGPGPNQFSPATSAQFCADPGFEWFWLRSHAYDDSNGGVPTDADTNFVFEGTATTRFANEDRSAMLENANTLEFTFDDADSGVNMVVNGERVVSAVTGEPFDRTVFGSREPSVLSGSRTAIMFEPGVYACVQSIEWFNEEEHVPEVPVGYIERVRDWADANPAVLAMLRAAIREQVIQLIQNADRDDVRTFARNFPRAANALRRWARNNPDQAQRAVELIHEIRSAEDGGAVLREWAQANPRAAAVLRAVTRARLIQLMLHADREDLQAAAETFPAATRQIRRWARNNPGQARRVVRVIRGVRNEASLLELSDEPAEEEPVEGTEEASTPIDFDSEEGPASEEEEAAFVMEVEPPEIWDGSTPIPEGPGWHRIDMTVGDLTELRAKGNSFERFYRFGNAEHRIMFAPRGELGLCMAVVDPVPGFGHATTGPILSNPDNHYSPDGSTPFAPRDDTVASSELKGDNAIGLVLPFSTPRRLRLQMSSINVVDDNAAELFSEMTLGMRNITHDQLSRAVYPVSQGFMGIQTGLPQDVSQGAENYEAWYIRPSNGAGPGPNQFNPATSAQFCADPGFEWFWLRAHAYDDSNGGVPTDADTNFVFEGTATTRFANEDRSAMLENTNLLEFTFDDADTGVNMVVNGQRSVSAVTGEPFDRTVFGSREPSVLSGSRTAIMFEPGVYACVQSIEWFNEEEVVEPPEAPVGYVDRVRDWAAENPAVVAVLRAAIREQVIQVVQNADRDDVRNFARNFPRAANALRQWARSNPVQAQRAVELIREIRNSEDGVAVLHEWAQSNPRAASVLRAVTRARLIQFILRADHDDLQDAAETFPAATRQIRRWARNNPGKARTVVRVIRGLRDETALLEMVDEPIEEPEEGTEQVSTLVDFDAEEGPVTDEQEAALEAQALTQDLIDQCNERRNRRTGGTCFFSNCYDWRGETTCRRGRCECVAGTCSARDDSGRRGVCFQPLEWQERRLQR